MGNAKDEEIPKICSFISMEMAKKRKAASTKRDPPKASTTQAKLPTGHGNLHSAQMKNNCISSLPSNFGIKKMQAQNPSKEI